MHKYTIVYIASLAIHWIAQWALELIPLVSPWQEPRSPPGWWYEFFGYYDWRNNLTSDDRPTSTLISLALEGVWRLLGMWIDEVGSSVFSSAVSVLRAIVGYVKSGYSTFQAWITWLEGRVGAATFWFATTVSDGVVWLYYRLPSEIRELTKSWSQIWEEIKEAVRSWARDRYDEIRTWVNNTKTWIVDWINTLGTWWNTAHNWLDDFRLNAAIRVAGWLGTAWTRLKTFERDCLDFWYSAWSNSPADFGSFFSDPVRWLYDRAENWIIQHVW